MRRFESSRAALWPGSEELYERLEALSYESCVEKFASKGQRPVRLASLTLAMEKPISRMRCLVRLARRQNGLLRLCYLRSAGPKAEFWHKTRREAAGHAAAL